jgi:putative intracellular protease/amidase
MKTRKCFLFVFDGFADWEPAMATAALSQFTDFDVIPFSKDGGSVRSFGNLKVQPDVSLKDVKSDEVDLLILPGGEMWDKGGNMEIRPLLNAVLKRDKIVAAICGATGFLARHGYLDSIRHTSNHLDYYLKQVAPDYKGEANYIDLPSVKDGNFITAGGTAPVEFAAEILQHFDLFNNKDLKTWFGYFRQTESAAQ